MSEEKAKAIVSKARRLFNCEERSNARSLWETISEFVLNNQSGIFNGETAKGARKTTRLFDSTAIQANQDLAASIHSTITNPATKWSNIRFKDQALNNNKEAVAWLDESNRIIHDFLNESNFDTMVTKNYQMFSAIGTMVLFVEEDPKDKVPGQFNGFRFNAWHMSEVALAEDESGVATTLYRKFKLTAGQLMDRWDDKLPENIKQAAKTKPQQEFEIFQEIRPNDPAAIKFNSAGLALPKERPFLSSYVMAKGNVILEETGYYELPAFAVRWGTMPGEVYGRGPGHLALPDIRTLNKVKELGLKAIAKSIDPPMLANRRDVLGNFTLNPGKLSVVRDINGFKELVPGTRFDVTQFAVSDLKASIKSLFFIDKLMLPPRTETGEQTAFEISQRLEQMQKVLGPTLSRLDNEFLTPLIVRCFSLLLRGGALPELPEVLRESGVDVNIQFVNPLNKSQKLQEVNNVAAWVQELAALAQIKPEVLDWVDQDAIAILSAQSRGVPESVVRSEKDVQKEREARAEAAQQEQQLQAGVSMADIAAKTGGQ